MGPVRQFRGGGAKREQKNDSFGSTSFFSPKTQNQWNRERSKQSQSFARSKTRKRSSRISASFPRPTKIQESRPILIQKKSEGAPGGKRLSIIVARLPNLNYLIGLTKASQQEIISLMNGILSRGPARLPIKEAESKRKLTRKLFELSPPERVEKGRSDSS
ncbi:unnamed protein product [Dovyalis caffra]|uniref:Uncharacterized protein n=1 Tax=Dovyalis caffra TaxID=77055 RepID=A0AAV1QRL9_9ROSI|nr:unnamed protein product [Dovyalis caffra]